jgi:hypothetical protein
MNKIRAILLVWIISFLSMPALAAPYADQAFQAIYSREWDWRTRQGLTDPDNGAIADRLPAIDAARPHGLPTGTRP